jgi:hypothetical protein
MKNRKEHLKNLFLSEIELIQCNDPTHVNELLREEGYDAEEVGKEGQSLIAKIKLKAAIENQSSIMKNKVEQAKLLLKKIQTSTEEGLTSIQERLNKKASAFQLNFRELKEINEADALRILNNMELLDILDEDSNGDPEE